MTSGVRTDAVFELWEKRKYEGFFHVEWLLVKDVPNHALTAIKMSNTPSKKSITSCRDCEEVLFDEVRPEYECCCAPIGLLHSRSVFVNCGVGKRVHLDLHRVSARDERLGRLRAL